MSHGMRPSVSASAGQRVVVRAFAKMRVRTCQKRFPTAKSSGIYVRDISSLSSSLRRAGERIHVNPREVISSYLVNAELPQRHTSNFDVAAQWNLV